MIKTRKVCTNDKDGIKFEVTIQCPICGKRVTYGRFNDSQKCNTRYYYGEVDGCCPHAPEWASIKSVENGTVQFRLDYEVNTFKCPICKEDNVVVGDFSGDDFHRNTPYDRATYVSYQNKVQELSGHTDKKCKHFHAEAYADSGVVFEQKFTKVQPTKKGKK